MQSLVPKAAGPTGDRLEPDLAKTLFEVHLPVGTSIRVSIKGLLEDDDWPVIFRGLRTAIRHHPPILWPQLLRQHDPSHWALEMSLVVGLFSISLLDNMSRQGAMGIDSLAGLHWSRVTSVVLEEGLLPTLCDNYPR